MLKAGHWNAPFDVGSPYSAMDVHAEIRELLMRSSADVKLQVPLGVGWSTRLPNTKGISAVCVGPKAGRAAAGKLTTQGQDGVWLNWYVHTGMPFCAETVRPR